MKGKPASSRGVGYYILISPWCLLIMAKYDNNPCFSVIVKIMNDMSPHGGRCRLQWPPPGTLGAVSVPGAAFSFFGNFRSRKEAVERLRTGLQPSKNRKPHELKLVCREAVVTASALE
jgi:hypothetical protein